MKIFVVRNRNSDLRAGAQIAEDFFNVVDENNNTVGKVTFVKNFPISFGGTIIEIEINNIKQAKDNGESESEQT